MADMFQTSVSGMLAFQRALATTSHNISNANTAGYSRQITDFSTLTPNLAGGSWIGTGVGVDAIRRMSDDSRLASVRINTSDFQRLEMFAALNGRIDNLLADEEAGLAPSLQSFFAAVQQSSLDPTDPTAREMLLTEANNLTSRLDYLDSRLAELDHEVNTRIEASVNEINQLAESVASLNQEIVVARGRAGSPPNDLLDQRDRLLEQLSGLVGTQVVDQGDGQVSVFMGNGQGLVIGNDANTLGVVPSEFDRTRNEIAFVTNGASVNITTGLSGGSLGGVLDFRRESLDGVRNQLGQVATSLAVQFNAQHRQGVVFEGGQAQLGGDFFSLGAPQVLGNRSGAVGPTVGIDSATVGELTSSDYRLQYDGTDWRLTRLSDNTSTLMQYDGVADSWTLTNAAGTTTLAAGEVPVVDGLSIDIDTAAPGIAGDAFLIRPTRGATASIDVAVTRPEQIAAALPVVGGDALNALGQSLNTGSGRLGGLGITGTVSADGSSNIPLASPLNFVFDADAGAFSVYSGAVAPGNLVTVLGYSAASGLAPVGGRGAATNTGGASLGPVSLSGTANAGGTVTVPLAEPLTLAYTANDPLDPTAGGTFSVFAGDPSDPANEIGQLAYDPATGLSGALPAPYDNLNVAIAGVPADGDRFEIANGIPGFENIGFSFSGAPADGDAFVIVPTTAARGDNGNLLKLAGLQSGGTMLGGDASYEEFYGSLVGRVGSQTQRANVNRDAQEVLLEQSVAARDEVSGVNLEEEAANMLRYQQAFQASAQMVTVADSIFQSLLNAVGR